jgi:hypothetical protein
MAESVESVDLAATPLPGPDARRGPLITIAVVLSIVGNAVAFMIPPLLPLIQARFTLGVSASAWIFTALTPGGGAGYVLIPRLLTSSATGPPGCCPVPR